MHKPKSLSDIRKERKEIRNVNMEHKKSMSRLDKIAVWITNHVGTMGFFLIIFIWTAIWLSWNTLATPSLRFDPFPAFVLWLFTSNMIQIFLMPLIMIGQNLQSQYAEARAEADYVIDKKAEMEVETIIMHLENQNELMQKMLVHLNQRNIAEKI